jgi:thiamine kinase-like enzyme
MATIMYEVGQILAKIQAYQFTKTGFFDDDLNIPDSLTQHDYLVYSQASLADPIVMAKLSSNMIAKINFYLEKYQASFPTDDQKNLVHADFDPANILVDQYHGKWVITGILDWEFAFSGSTLCDVANMLRYAHQIPSIYETSFLQGLKEGGVILPDSWQTSIHLLNLLSLLDCLVHSANDRPNQSKDIIELIEHITSVMQG